MKTPFLRLCRRTWRLLLLLMLFFATFLPRAHAQDPAQYGTPFTGVPNPMDVNLYEVNIRPFSAAGNLAGVTARLDNIKALGINVIYLMPVYPHGTDSRSSVSPYCIKDFESVATEYGSLTDFRALVDGAHSRGIAVILDFVVNGTSWDHPWITAHPNWYMQDGSGNIQQLANFSDVAALNFANTDMRTAIINSMRYWVFAGNVDGFRCDFANNPPLDFWTQAITNLRGISTHKLIMFAEGDHQNLFQGGFDYSFGDDFYYDALKPIAQSGGNVNSLVTSYNNSEYLDATGTNQVMRYTDNHDVDGNSGGNALSVFSGTAGVMANFVVCAYMHGVPFLFGSQEVAFNQQIPWPYTTVKIDWTQNANVTAEFTKVLQYRTSSTAIRQGSMTNYSDANVCAFTKTSGSEKVAVMVNLRNASSTFTIPSGMAGSYKDAYSGTTTTLTSGASQTLTAFQYIVLTNANVPVVSVTGVTVSPSTATISAGLTQQLSAAVAPSNATNQNVTWTSSNTAIATVSSTGLVTGVAAGTATITATTQDGSKTSTCAVTINAATTFTVYFSPPSGWGTAMKIYWWSALPAGVLADGTWPGVSMTNAGNGWYSYTFTNVTSTNLIFDDGTNQTANLSRNKTGWYVNGTWYDTNPGTITHVTGVTVAPTTAAINVGSTQQLTATIAPSNATNTAVTWASSNTAVATVSATGLVTAVAGGTATITATTQDGAKTATCAVTANSGQSFTVYFSPPSGWGTGIKVYWWSAQPAGALADGTWPGVTMTNAGNGWYSYTFNNITSTSLIFNDGSNQTANLSRNKTGWYVNGTWYDTNPGTAISVTGVSVSPASFSVSVGGTQQVTATIAPSNATNKNVTWQSSNTAVATVSSTGLVTGVASGIATITATTSDGAKIANAEVTVGTQTYYQILNRWQANTYLYDSGNGKVSYGTSATGASYQWAKVDAGGGYFYLKNRATGNIIHVQDQTGSVECTAGNTTWYSAMWQAATTGDGWNYIQNRWQTSDWIHIENLTGSAQYSGAQAGWYSAEWQFTNPVTQ